MKVWRVGPHEVWCADSTKPSVRADVIGGRRIGVSIIYPPLEMREPLWVPLLADPSIVFGTMRHMMQVPREWWRFERVIVKPSGHRMATTHLSHMHAMVAQVGTVKVLPQGRETIPSVVYARPSDWAMGKPVSLIAEHLNLWSPPGLVFDPFGGSGSGAVAAATAGRSSVTMEISEARAKRIAERLAAVAGVSSPDMDDDGPAQMALAL